MVDPHLGFQSWALLLSLALPWIGVVVIFFTGGFRTNPAKVPLPWPGIFAVVLAVCTLLASIGAASATRNSGVINIGTSEWIPGFGSALTLHLDWLSAWLLMLLEIIGLMVTVFSVGYMREEADQRRYFGALLFFVGMMKLLILAGSYLLLFAGWEGVGLASYVLIGYHHEVPQAAEAATKAFIVNRIGDAGFIIALIAMLWTCHSTNFDVVAASAHRWPHGTLLLVCSLLVVGAAGKSAQFPLHVWLPDAMRGPTPVSALIHSATMVCAGVYLLTRSHFLLALAPEVNLGIAALGTVTALFAGSVALVEDDIKRVLAYSTISQIGFMFLAIGVGANRAAMYHVVTHAFFKSLLFLCAGSVIHALHGEQNLKHMGGLRKEMPITFWTMCIAGLTLAGVPGLSAFFSKDLILESAFAAGRVGVGTVAVLTSGLTAIYSWRLIALTFLGEPRRHRLAAHEATVSMRVPMVTLAICCVLTGWLFVPLHWSEWETMLLSSALALAGIAIAWHYYVSHPERREGLDVRFAALASFLRNRWFVDAVFEEHFVEGFVLRTAEGAAIADSVLIDGAVNGTAWSSRQAAATAGWTDSTVVDGAVRLVSGSVRFFSWPFRALQTGVVQSYALLFLVGAIAAVGYCLSR